LTSSGVSLQFRPSNCGPRARGGARVCLALAAAGGGPADRVSGLGAAWLGVGRCEAQIARRRRAGVDGPEAA
jgi:hypothetical protein